MVQPVMDTLRLSERLQGAGVERGQADGMARALGAELDEHVVVRKDVEAGFAGVRAEIALTRSNLEGEIALTRTELEGEMALTRTEIEGKIDRLRTEINTKFTWGFGLALTFLSVLVGIGLIDLNKPTSATPAITSVPGVVPGATPAQPPGSTPAPPASGGATSPGAVSSPLTGR